MNELRRRWDNKSIKQENNMQGCGDLYGMPAAHWANLDFFDFIPRLLARFWLSGPSPS